MKRIVYVCIVVVLVLTGIKLGSVYGDRQSSLPQKTAVTAKISLTPTPALPETLSIPKLSVTNRPIESVAMDSEGRMGVPSIVTDTAWYNLGPRPGSVGNAVIDGHFDTVTGAPSVFYNLKTLTSGDTITVTDANGTHQVFVITKVTAFPTDQFPLQLVFGDNTVKRNLNLITCGGTWDKAAHNYLERTVVFSTLQNK